MGRPISSPPSESHPTVVETGSKRQPRRWFRAPEEVRQAIRADYLAGMSWADIESKHGLSRGSMARFIKDLPPRIGPRPPAKPTRNPGESSSAFGVRVQRWMVENDPDYNARWRKRTAMGVKKAHSTAKRRAKAMCVTLNKTETRGIWHTTETASAAMGGLSAFLTSKFVTTNAIDTCQFGRFRIYLIPNSVPVQNPSTATDIAPAIVVAPQPQPSFLRRWFGWLLP